MWLAARLRTIYAAWRDRWRAANGLAPLCTNRGHVRLRCIQCEYTVHQCLCRGIDVPDTSVLCRRCAGTWLPFGMQLLSQTVVNNTSQLARLHTRIQARAARLPGSPERRAEERAKLRALDMPQAPWGSEG